MMNNKGPCKSSCRCR